MTTYIFKQNNQFFTTPVEEIAEFYGDNGCWEVDLEEGATSCFLDDEGNPTEEDFWECGTVELTPTEHTTMPPKGESLGMFCCCGDSWEDHDDMWCSKGLSHMHEVHTVWYRDCCGSIVNRERRFEQEKAFRFSLKKFM